METESNAETTQNRRKWRNEITELKTEIMRLQRDAVISADTIRKLRERLKQIRGLSDL